MKEYMVVSGNYAVPVYEYSALVIGSGAAGLNAADTLHSQGMHDIAVVTENLKGGTSRNTGSDKQTYYKLSLAGTDPDSIRALAETLHKGQCVDGDIALCEAASSVSCFMKLVNLGVPFPKNRYGEFVGYKTDHDPVRRATSAGPYTSKFMTEVLEASVTAKNISIYNHYQVIKILTDKGKAAGVLCLDLNKTGKDGAAFAVFSSANIIWAAGGPSGMYLNTVYPESQEGSTGLAFEAGVKGRNLTEWQYGLASVKPRWNVSGTYMQTLPRFVSANPDGSDEREFLYGFFEDEPELLSMVFLKGYQWPFDVRKLRNGSSIIDVLVFIEINKGRRVFLDYRKNPRGAGDIDYSRLSSEARQYLAKAGACFGTPVDRLRHMNLPAYEFYRARGVDLVSDMLEISLSAQHNNGGLAVDHWWQSSLEGFFPAGEAAATHGVYRPGGSALNAGQVGSYRAACFIANRRKGIKQDFSALEAVLKKELPGMLAIAEVAARNKDTIDGLLGETKKNMSLWGAAFRDPGKILELQRNVKSLLDSFSTSAGTSSPLGLSKVFRLRDQLISQYVYLGAMENYCKQNGKSRGSALYRDDAGERLFPSIPDIFPCSIDDGGTEPLIQEVVLESGTPVYSWRTARPIPEDDDFFENVWSTFRENGNIY